MGLFGTTKRNSPPHADAAPHGRAAAPSHSPTPTFTSSSSSSSFSPSSPSPSSSSGTVAHGARAPTADAIDAGRAPCAPAAGRRPPADVEVREVDLDDEEFSSTFGSGVSQFADTAPGRDDADDPWSSRLRLD
jgi:hypothetical protein